MFEQLQTLHVRDRAGRRRSDDPTVLATLMRRAEERRAERAAGADADDRPDATATDESAIRATRSTRATMLQNDRGHDARGDEQFLLASAVSSYFLYGAGSLDLADTARLGR